LGKTERGKIKKFFLFLGISIFWIFIFNRNISAVEKIPLLRVGIFLNQDELNISGDGVFKIYNLKSEVLIGEENNKIIKMLPHKKGIEILGKSVYSGPIKIVPVGKTKIIVLINGQKYRYRGDIEVDIDKVSRKLNIINIISMEEYLYGVLKKEISPQWPAEALKAQAIASRTFAIFTINMNKYIDKDYNICATTNSQAYGGVNHEDTLTNRAVDETRGLIMVYNGKLINAVYHSDSGGYTEDSENVWGSYMPYLRSVKSIFEEKVSSPHHTWEYSINEKNLTEKLQEEGYKIDSVASIKIAKKSETGRINELAFTSGNNEIIYMKANDFRRLIGPDLIRSTLFDIKVIEKELNIMNNTEGKEIIEKKEDQEESIKDILEQKKDWTIKELIELMKKRKEEKKKEEKVYEVKIEKIDVPLTFLFSGLGDGHGVGMSQWGAYGMSVQGARYQDILKYYYKGIKIIKEY
jgi:stage II sporulation protein D